MLKYFRWKHRFWFSIYYFPSQRMNFLCFRISSVSAFKDEREDVSTHPSQKVHYNISLIYFTILYLSELWNDLNYELTLLFRRKKEMGLVSSMISILFFSPSIEAMYEKRGGGISIGSTFLQTFIAISSGNRKLKKESLI